MYQGLILFRRSAGASVALACLVGCGGAWPSNTPSSSTINANPNAMSFDSVGTATAQSVVVTEAGYTGPLTPVGTCAGIVSIAPTTAWGPSAQFTVSPIAAGNCKLTVSGGAQANASIAISVTNSGLEVQGNQGGRR